MNGNFVYKVNEIHQKNLLSSTDLQQLERALNDAFRSLEEEGNKPTKKEIFIYTLFLFIPLNSGMALLCSPISGMFTPFLSVEFSLFFQIVIAGLCSCAMTYKLLNQLYQSRKVTFHMLFIFNIVQAICTFVLLSIAIFSSSIGETGFFTTLYTTQRNISTSFFVVLSIIFFILSKKADNYNEQKNN